MKVGFIGAGKVGTCLGKYFSYGDTEIVGYYSKSPKSAAFSASFTNSVAFNSAEELVKQCDTVFVTVPDEEIPNVWKTIENTEINGKIICHCSGSVSSRIFDGADEKGAFVYSVHPLQAISNKTGCMALLENCVFTVEGSEQNLQYIKKYIESFGNTVITITAEKKALYHAAAVFVSNLPVALAELGIQMLERCGFGRDDAQKALAPLILGSAENIAKQGPVNALTGPVERGDAETVRKHLTAVNEDEREIYLLLTEKLISIAQIKNPERDYTEIKKIRSDEL